VISETPNFVAGRVSQNGTKLCQGDFEVTHKGGGIFGITVSGGGGDAVLLLNQYGKSSDYIDSAYLLRTPVSDDGSFEIATTVGGAYRGARNFNFVLIRSDFAYPIHSGSSGYSHGNRRGACLLGKTVDDYSHSGRSHISEPPEFFQVDGNPNKGMTYLDIEKPEYDGTKTTELRQNAYTISLKDSYYQEFTNALNPREFDEDWNHAGLICPIARSTQGEETGAPTNGSVLRETGVRKGHIFRAGINMLGVGSDGHRHFDRSGAFQCAILTDQPDPDWQAEHRWIWGMYDGADLDISTVGLQIVRQRPGTYRATFDTPYDKTPVVLATAVAEENYVEKAVVLETSETGFTIITTDKRFDAADRRFSFLVCPVA